MWGESVFNRQVNSSFSICTASTDRPNVFFSDFGLVVRFTATEPTALDGISGIVKMAAKDDVPNTSTDIALMTDNLALRNWSEADFVADCVRSPRLAVFVQSTVSAWENGSVPDPARLFVSYDSNKRPEVNVGAESFVTPRTVPTTELGISRTERALVRVERLPALYAVKRLTDSH